MINEADQWLAFIWPATMRGYVTWSEDPVINESKKRPSSLIDHLPPARLSNAAITGLAGAHPVSEATLAAQRRQSEPSAASDEHELALKATDQLMGQLWSMPKGPKSRPATAAKCPVTGNKPRHGNAVTEIPIVTEIPASVTKNRRGRPKSGAAMSQAQRARGYRVRKQGNMGQ